MNELFQTYPMFYLSIIFLLGLLFGSFLNVVILRLPIMMQADWNKQCCELLNIEQKNDIDTDSFNLITPQSHCPRCKHRITALENIPLISYLFLKGQCRACHHKIPIRYPFIELLSGVAVVIVAYYFGITERTFFAMCLTWALIALAGIDFDHQLLPDDITLPFLWLGIAFNLYFEAPISFTSLEHSILGAIAGYGSLWLVYIAFKLTTGKEGMGHGDFKLLALLGAWLGWQLLPLIIILSSLIASTIGIALIFFKAHDKTIPIPFGPYLAIAGWVAMLWGQPIMSLYLTAFV